MELEKDVWNLKSKRDSKGHEWLFSRRDGRRYGSSDWSSMAINRLAKYLGNRRVGSQNLRKITVSEFRKGERSLREKRELSGKMLHSVTTAEQNYLKYASSSS